MSDWMLIRVVLTGHGGDRLPSPPGRRLIVDPDHAFADLADAIDTAFGRYDLSPLHRFDVGERRLVVPDDGADEDESDEEEDSGEVALGDVALQPGSTFTYLFDLEERWRHDCTVEAIDADPRTLLDDEPDLPTPVDGWGVLPDQYGRVADDGGDDALDGEGADWEAATAAAWQTVMRALERPWPSTAPASLPAVAAGLRRGGGRGGPGSDVLLAAAGLEPGEAPEDDEELWVLLAAGVVEPQGDVPLDDAAVAAWTGLEPADWAAAVIELGRGGPGTPASPEALVELVARCPELGGGELAEEDEAAVLEGFEVVVALWRSLGVVDGEGRLSELGAWGLPRALEAAWAPLDAL